MNVTRKQAEKLGFQGARMYTHSASCNHYYKVDEDKGTITVITNLFPQTISVFKLTPIQIMQFLEGDIKITPPGCINATGGKALTKCRILLKGTFDNMAHVKAVLAESEKPVIKKRKSVEITISKPFSGIRNIPESCSFSNIENGEECDNVTNLFTLLEYGFGIRGLEDKQKLTITINESK